MFISLSSSLNALGKFKIRVFKLNSVLVPNDFLNSI